MRLGLILILGVIISGCIITTPPTTTTTTTLNIYGSISGRVTPPKAGIRVQVIQNLSLVAETKTNSDGSYRITNLPEGKYGLLFIVDVPDYVYDLGYDYNGEFDGNEPIIVVANKDSPNNDINLDDKWEDFIADQISIKFRENSSVEEQLSVISKHNCSIIDQGLKWYYVLNIPDNKTILEMIRLFKSEPIVEIAAESTRTHTAANVGKTHTAEKNKTEEKYFDWRMEFRIYDQSKNSPEGFPPDDIFEIEKNKILSLIPETEYRNYELTYTTYGHTRNGFSVEVTQTGHKVVMEEIIGKSVSQYLSTIYYEQIIDPKIQVMPSDETQIKECEKDRECIKVDSGCCGCSAGGEATTINRKYHKYWSEKLDRECRNVGCIAVMSNHWTCFAEPKCINNKCELIEQGKA